MQAIVAFLVVAISIVSISRANIASRNNPLMKVRTDRSARHEDRPVFDAQMRNSESLSSRFYRNRRSVRSAPSLGIPVYYTVHRGSPFYDFRVPFYSVYPVIRPTYATFPPATSTTEKPSDEDDRVDDDDYSTIERLDLKVDPGKKLDN